MTGVHRSPHNRRYVLPRRLLEEYQAFVASRPEPPTGMTYLELFMRERKLLSREHQATLLEDEYFGRCSR